MKRVLVIITTAFVRTGGLASVMMNYWRAMDKTELSFDFASTNAIDDLLNAEISKEGCNYYQLPPRKQVLNYFNTLRKICKGYDVVHVHANSATSVLELLAAKKAGVPQRIHHNHNSNTKYPFLNKVLRPLFVYSYTDAIACSEAAGEWLFGKGKYIVLPNAIDIEKFKFNLHVRKRIRDEFKINKDEFVIGHVGKFVEAKNHGFLIEIFSKYHSKHPNSKLLLVGDGILRTQIESCIKNSGCADAIILAGLRSDISDLVQAFDVFVFPSIHEGLPLSVLEAQSSGLPCIISSNIDKKVAVGCDVVIKDLSDGDESWAEAISLFDFAKSREDRCLKNYKLITDAHYNIMNEANQLKEFYNKHKL